MLEIYIIGYVIASGITAICHIGNFEYWVCCGKIPLAFSITQIAGQNSWSSYSPNIAINRALAFRCMASIASLLQ
jgi:hypothetical protein